MKSRQMTIEFAAQALMKRGLISRENYRTIMSKGNAHRARLQKLHDASYQKRPQLPHYPVSPAEVIASFAFEIQGKKESMVTEDLITEVLAADAGLEYRKIDPLKLDLEVVTSHIPRPFAQRHLVIPVEQKDGVVTLAVADPFNLDAIESLKTARRMKIRLVLSSKSDILKTIREFFGFRASITAAEAEMTPGVDLGNLEQFVRLKGQGEIEATDQHIVNAVEYLLQYAFDQRASDIHIEPKKDKSFVRVRIDGLLHYIHTVPRPIHAPIVSRIKMLSRMDIAEKRRPQDGRIKTNYRGKDIELRVSTLPVAFGGKVVVRIFDPEVLLQDLDNLGFYPRDFQIYNSFIRRPNGIILVTGPTGSGKTTTLYSTLRTLASPDVNIVTIEEPIELVVEEFNQVGVQQALGVTFANILRTILRQDPDIIMVGEIRDQETADNAVQSALTGHLVLSTLHTNDAPSAIVRLLDLGVPSFLLSSTIVGIVAQRLVRKICPHCKRERRLTEDEIENLQLVKKQYQVSYGEGCLECRGTGYRGRTGVYEVMDFTDRLRAALTDDIALGKLYEIARADGMLNLRRVATKKMLEGITTYEEVVAVT